MNISETMALYFAANNGYSDLTYEIESLIEEGYPPIEALREWDIVPTKAEVLEYIYGNLNSIII